jgi:hypothetical protein
VVEACAIILPPIGFVLSFAKLIPSGFATTFRKPSEVDYSL